MRSVFSFLLLGLIGACGSPAKTPSTKQPLTIALATEQLTLTNGLLVVLHADPSAHQVAIRLRYYTGGKDDPLDQVGLSHLYEHMMFGVTARTPNGFSRALESVGGAGSNATTYLDHTDYFETVGPASLSSGLWLEADRMSAFLGASDEERLARERLVVKNEIRERSDRTQLATYGLVSRYLFPPDHPYVRDTRDQIKGVDAITLEELRAFGKEHYRPDNATLVVAGAFDIPTAKRLVKEHFGHIEVGAPIQRKSYPAPVPRTLDIDVKDPSGEPRLVLAWLAPPVGADGYDELQLGADVIDRALTPDLVTKRELADHVHTSFYGGHLGAVLVLEIVPKNPRDANRILPIVEGNLEQVSKNLPTWDGYEAVRTSFVSLRALRLASMEERADEIQGGIEYDGRPDGRLASLTRDQTIPPEDVSAVLRRFIVGRPHLTMRVSR